MFWFRRAKPIEQDANPVPHNLLACRSGAAVRIEHIPVELDCAQRLRELGIMEGAEVVMLRRSDPLLVLAKDSRIAIDRATARLIEVSSVAV